MTYALAWKSDSEVFLAADTALTTTSSEQLKLDLSISSFGQNNYLEEKKTRKTEEKIHKLFLKKNVGVTFAGNYRRALEVVESFYKKIDTGLSIIDSLKESLFLYPITASNNLQLIVGYYKNGPKILSFNAQNDFSIIEDQDIAQIGCPSETHKDLTEEWIDQTNNIFPIGNIAELRLTAILGILQSYNYFSPQMDRGIGGAFCGLYIGQDGGKWQPDILYTDYGIRQGKLVSTCFRHNCLVINSPTIGQSRCFVNNFLEISQDYAYQQALKAVKKGKKLQSNAEFQYIVFINFQNATLTLVEMKRQHKHELLRIKPFKDGFKTGTEIALFSKMQSIIKRDRPGLVIIPYKRARREQRIPNYTS